MLGSKDERHELWSWARQHQADLKNERYEVERRLKAIDAEMKRFARIERVCWPNPCKACAGHGKIREWLAQDESRVIDCSACKGTGEGPEKDAVTRLGEVPT